MEKAILREINKVVDEYYDSDTIVLKEKSSYEKRIDVLYTERMQVEKKASKLKKDSVSLYRDKLNGLFNDEQFKLLNDEFNSELNKCNERLNIIDVELSRLDAEKKNKRNISEVLGKYKNVENLTFELVNELIDGIYIGKLDAETKERDIEIHWKF